MHLLDSSDELFVPTWRWLDVVIAQADVIGAAVPGALEQSILIVDKALLTQLHV
jgi:hypothetical protein